MAWAAAAPYIIGGAASLLGGILGSKGQKAAANQQMNFMNYLYNPQRIQGAGLDLNPWLKAALMGGGKQVPNGATGFGPDLQRLVNGQDLSQYSLNLPLQNSQRSYNQNLDRFSAMLGRSGAQGGLGQTYALANMAGANNARANIYQQYGLWREGQRRQDIGTIFDWLARNQQTAVGLAGSLGQSYAQPQNSAQTWAGALQGFNQNVLPYWLQYNQQKQQQTPAMPQPGPSIPGGWMNQQ